MDLGKSQAHWETRITTLKEATGFVIMNVSMQLTMKSQTLKLLFFLGGGRALDQ